MNWVSFSLAELHGFDIAAAFFYGRIFWDEPVFESQVKHHLACLGVQAYEHEGERLLGGLAIEGHERFCVVDSAQFFTERLHFAVVS